MVAAHEAGLDVARLASGDLSVFSALAEQMRRLDAAGRALRPVPGRARVRRRGRRAAAGADRADGRPDRHAHAHLRAGHPHARRRGAGRAAPLRRHAGAAPVGAPHRRGGGAPCRTCYGPDCPAAVVAFASREHQVVLRGPLSSLPEQVREAGIRMAAVVIVGPALAAEHFPDSHLYSDRRRPVRTLRRGCSCSAAPPRRGCWRGSWSPRHDVTVSLAGRVRSPLPLPGRCGSAGSAGSTGWPRGCGPTAPTRSWTPRTRSRRR